MGKMPCRFKRSAGPLHLVVFAPIALRRLALSFRAMIWHVSSATGNDANNGRGLKTAFKTLARATDAAKAGDTILITPGAYDQDLAARVGAVRAANIVIAVAGSE